jgi:hypothetical protein
MASFMSGVAQLAEDLEVSQCLAEQLAHGQASSPNSDPMAVQ